MMKFVTGLIVVVVLVFVAINVAGNIVLAKALESALGVKVDVKKVQLGLFTQQAGIFGINVHNPEGFDEKSLAVIPEIFVVYDLASLFRNQIHIKELRLNLDEITVERNASGQFNLIELPVMKLSNEKPAGKDETRKPQEKSRETPSSTKRKPMEIRIDEVRLSLGRVRYVDMSSGKKTVREFPLEIKDLIIRDVTEPQQVVQQIVIKTMQKVGLNAMIPDMGQFSAFLKGEIATQMKEGFGTFAQKVLGGQGA